MRWRDGHARRPDLGVLAEWVHAIRMAIARNLDAYLRTADIATTELAAALGVHRTAVYKWLSGAELPSLHRLITIALALRCPLATLLTPELLGAEPPPQPEADEEVPLRWRSRIGPSDAAPADVEPVP